MRPFPNRTLPFREAGRGAGFRMRSLWPPLPACGRPLPQQGEEGLKLPPVFLELSEAGARGSGGGGRVDQADRVETTRLTKSRPFLVQYGTGGREPIGRCWASQQWRTVLITAAGAPVDRVSLPEHSCRRTELFCVLEFTGQRKVSPEEGVCAAAWRRGESSLRISGIWSPRQLHTGRTPRRMASLDARGRQGLAGQFRSLAEVAHCYCCLLWGVFDEEIASGIHAD